MTMKKLFSKDNYSKIKNCIITTAKCCYQFLKIQSLKLYYNQSDEYTNMRYAVFAVVSIGIIAAVISIGVLVHSKSKANVPVHFDRVKAITLANLAAENNFTVPASTRKLQHQLKAVKQALTVHDSLLNNQLQSIQSNLSGLASETEVQQLQQQLLQPNTQLLEKMANLQTSVQRILQHQHSQQWVNPETVDKCFQLVAVQGFSDGMRAIINVDGNQAALSINEPCPACCGWTLQSLSFSQQTAVFAKKQNLHVDFVKLQTN